MTKHLPIIYTIGHSNLPLETFLGLLKDAGIGAIADVRSSPWSRFNPQFNRDDLKDSLRSVAIEYSYLGDELGGRPKDSRYFCDGVADYRQMARTPHFQSGLDRVEKGASKYKIALLCSEQNPLECHRCLLVGRAFSGLGYQINHLLQDGTARTQADIEKELLRLAGQDTGDLFAPYEQQLENAYFTQNKKAAFSEISQSVDSIAAE